MQAVMVAVVAICTAMWSRPHRSVSTTNTSPGLVHALHSCFSMCLGAYFGRPVQAARVLIHLARQQWVRQHGSASRSGGLASLLLAWW